MTEKRYITRECTYSVNNINLVKKNIILCSKICNSLSNIQHRFMVFISMFEYVLNNWNDEFRNYSFLSELLSKLNIITNNKSILEKVVSSMYENTVNESLEIINYWKIILSDELSCVLN